LKRVYSDFVAVCGHHVGRADDWHSLGLNHDDANDLEDLIQYTFQEAGLGRSLYEKYADLSWAPSVEDYVCFLSEAYKSKEMEDDWHSLLLSLDYAIDLVARIEYTFLVEGLWCSLYDLYADLSCAQSLEDYVGFLSQAS